MNDKEFVAMIVAAICCVLIVVCVILAQTGV